MKQKYIHNIKKSGFKTPDHYFEEFDERLLSKLENKSPFNSVKSSGFKTPDAYFEAFDDRLLASLPNNNKPKVIPLFSWRKVAYISGIAASILLLFSIFFNNPKKVTFDSLETVSIENYLYGEDFNSYDIASYLTVDDLTLNDFNDTNFSEESLEDYLLQNTDIEDLITE